MTSEDQPSTSNSTWNTWLTALIFPFLFTLRGTLTPYLTSAPVGSKDFFIVQFLFLTLLFGGLGVVSVNHLRLKGDWLLPQQEETFGRTILSWAAQLVRSLMYFIPLMVAVIAISQTFAINGSKVWELVLIPGVFEEVAFRGFFLLVLLERYEEEDANFWTALVFGGWHLTTFIWGNLSLTDSFLQMIYSYFFGYLLGLVVLKTKKLLPAIILHVLFNVSFLVNVADLWLRSFRLVLILAFLAMTVFFLIGRQRQDTETE